MDHIGAAGGEAEGKPSVDGDSAKPQAQPPVPWSWSWGNVIVSHPAWTARREESALAKAAEKNS